MKRHPFSGHCVIKVAGHECTIARRGSAWVIFDIGATDSAGEYHSFIGFVSLDGTDMHYPVFRQQIIPGDFNSMKSAVNWVRFAVNEGKGYKYL